MSTVKCCKCSCSSTVLTIHEWLFVGFIVIVLIGGILILGWWTGKRMFG